MDMSERPANDLTPFTLDMVALCLQSTEYNRIAREG